MTSWSDSGKLRLHFIEHRTNDGTNAGTRLFFGLKKFVAGSLHLKHFGIHFLKSDTVYSGFVLPRYVSYIMWY